MRKGLQGVLWILVLSSFVALALGRNAFDRQPQVRPVRQVVVVDSKGKTVGAVFGGSRARVTVLLEVEQHLAAVEVARDRFYPGNLCFESENCLGTPWLCAGFSPVYDPPGLLSPAVIRPPGQTLYVPAPGTQLERRTIRSSLKPDDVCETNEFTGYMLPLHPLLDLNTVFTPPFSLKTMP